MISAKKNKFYVTTPIYYVTAKPHLGSLYSTLLADVTARWYKIQGYDTFFLTGTDEHGQKVAQAADKAGLSPQAFVDSFIPAYKELWHAYNLDYTYFIRTTDKDHVKAVQQWLTQLLKQGDIYKSFYTGLYCTPCETFVTEEACPSCCRPTIEVAEECYFFRLSAYQDQLLAFYAAHPDFITPRERAHEIIEFVKMGLKDLSISRTTISWGIPFPGDTKHVTYVWADALNNYITAVGYGDVQRTKEFEYWWPADLQVMGKDIIRFHAIYWPAFLMASGLSLPKKLLVHGWIKVGEQKMSKSLGNVVDPEVLRERYGADSIRYYLTRHMAITQDSPFSIEDLEQRLNADLANDLGNLVQRMLLLAEKYGMHVIQPPQSWGPAEVALYNALQQTLREVDHTMQDYMMHRANAEIWKFINAVNSYFQAQEPWKLAATHKERFIEVLSATAHSLQSIGYLVWPVMPQKMEELLQSLGTPFTLGPNYLDRLKNQPWNCTFELTKSRPLFNKYETEQSVIEQSSIEQSKIDQSEKHKIGQEQAAVEEPLSLDELNRVVLVVGTIITVEDIEGSDKLYKLTVDCGSYGIRTILSGIKQWFKQEDLVAQQTLFVINLKPRIMRGIESQGMMMLAQTAEGKRTLMTPQERVLPGVRLA